VIAARHETRLITLADPEYPRLLSPFEHSPVALYVKGSLGPSNDPFPVAIVGSRDCSAYGIEQAERFGGVLARAGLTIVSGGARGIDAAAHRAALRSGGRTIAVLGCGLGHVYPAENRELFDTLVRSGSGALVSELPMDTPPLAENFPARNRIISGLSLGVVVIEAALKSGALITARVATEEHGREVFAVPGRVDSPSSRGTLTLLRDGEAHLVIEPIDVVQALESAANHAQSDRSNQSIAREEGAPGPELFAGGRIDLLSAQVLECLGEPLTMDQLIERTAADAGILRAQMTLLEIQGQVSREGSRFRRRSHATPFPGR
jgi:DNA processing protein